MNLKSMLCGVGVLMLSAAAQAAVVDRFDCKMELKDLISGQFGTSRLILNGVRQSLNSSPQPGVYYTYAATSGSMFQEQGGYSMGVDLSISYTHALKEKGQGIVEARQLDCIGASTSFCRKSMDPSGACWSSTSACSVSDPDDPFGENSGWDPVGVVNGVPLFNTRALRPIEGQVDELDQNGNPIGVVGQYRITCEFKGTVE